MRTQIVTITLAVILFSGHGAAQKNTPVQSVGNNVQPVGNNPATPLILENNEGEQLVRRPRDTLVPTAPFTIKVDRKNGGSQKMWLFTEDIPPGRAIPRHKHLDQDEILLIQTGTAHIWLGNQQREVHAGAIVFIPSDTWISLKNTGSENISLTSIFSDPGFDDFMRCVSSPPGQSPTALTRQEFQNCQHLGHAMYESTSAPAVAP